MRTSAAALSFLLASATASSIATSPSSMAKAILNSSKKRRRAGPTLASKHDSSRPDSSHQSSRPDSARFIRPDDQLGAAGAEKGRRDLEGAGGRSSRTTTTIAYSSPTILSPSSRRFPQKKQQQQQQPQRTALLRNLASDIPPPGEGGSAGANQQSCDAAFLTCLPHEKCLNCFETLQGEGIDWTNVSPETPCSDVVTFLTDRGHCTNLQGDVSETDVFCDTFDNCVVWDDDGMDDDFDGNSGMSGKAGSADAAGSTEDFLDCDALTECDWDGIHKAFVGDGSCDEKMPGCYNHAICEYDGGDCCPDTCRTSSFSHVDCGQEGFTCIDPTSDHCDPKWTAKCEKEVKHDATKEEEDEVEVPNCEEGTTLYRLVQFDSWGDGWDDTVLTVMRKSDDESSSEHDHESHELYKGGLKTGSQGTAYLCLSKSSPVCYNVRVTGGSWGNEVSWEIRPLAAGAPTVAAGGGRSDCDFAIAGNTCETTCNGVRPDTTINDPDYQSYKELSECIEKTCVIQVGACSRDEGCAPCLEEDDAPAYCYSNDNFNQLVNCAMCGCTDDLTRKEFCEEMPTTGSASTGQLEPYMPLPEERDEEKSSKGPPKCNADQTLSGSKAVLAFSQCSAVDQVTSMITNYDENNFGSLDLFEACAHSFKNDAMHGGRTAMECMRILHGIVTQGNHDDQVLDNQGPDGGPPAGAIGALANHLYGNAEEFCECAVTSSKDAPLCESFVHFKTLLRETLDACLALDEIDCDAWEEFHAPCKSNLQKMYNSVDFTKQEQCEYVHNDECGGAGPFPSFRRLDCAGEISKAAWDFHTLYQRDCLKDASAVVPTPAVTPKAAPATPHVAPPVPTPIHPAGPTAPTKPYYPSSGGSSSSSGGKSGGDGKPYYSPPDEEPASPATKPYKAKKKHHHFLSFLFVTSVVGAAYWYKRRNSYDGFDLYRYRQSRLGGAGGGGGGMLGGTRSYGMGDSGAYEGLSMEGSCSFEPPTLPPTPSAVDGSMT